MKYFKVDEEIQLKILENDDALALFDLVEKNRFYLRQWLPWIDTNTTVEESLAFIRSSQEQYDQNFGFQCGIWFHHQLSGVIGFQRIDWLNRNVEIGYWLAEKFQGHGIATKSCRKMIDVAFNDYQLHRVQIRCATGNSKSRAIIERLGFISEGIIQEAEFLYDHYVDLHIFGMLADHWKVTNDTQ
jgi:ribosomal-protein-serine acetyltransferase